MQTDTSVILRAARVEFANESDARQQFDAFDIDDDAVDSIARKRDGRCHVILVRVLDETACDRVMKAYQGVAGVLAIHPIDEKEFWEAPSNSI